MMVEEEDDTLFVDEKSQDSDEEDTLVLNEEEEEEPEEEEDEEEPEDIEEEPEDIEEEEGGDDEFDSEGENGEIDISDIYDDVFKVNKNVFNKNRKSEPPPVSKVKKTKKRKNIDYTRNVIEDYREKSIEIFTKYTTVKNANILDTIIYKLVTDNPYKKNEEREYMSLSRISISYLSGKKIKGRDFVPILRTAVFRGDWIIPDQWKDEKFRQDQITTNIENPPLPKSGVVRCPRCVNNPKLKDNENRGKRTDYYQKQTRSSDEPMTVFAFCYDCNYRWTF